MRAACPELHAALDFLIFISAVKQRLRISSSNFFHFANNTYLLTYLLTHSLSHSLIHSLTHSLIYSVEQSPSWEANRFSASQDDSSHFMEPEGSIPHLQVPAVGPYPEYPTQ